MSETRQYRVPGRINLIGEHTDYNLGFVMPGAVDLGLDFRVEIMGGDDHIFFSSHYQEEDHCSLNGAGLKRGWAIFFKQVLYLLEQRGHIIKGIRCEFGGNLPVGAGMSSSSAITCGLIYALNDCFDLGLDKKDIVELASEAERESGLDGGMMDQFAVVFGQENTLLYLDCEQLEYEEVQADFQGYELVLFDTRKEHSLVDSAYNDRHDECKRGLKAIQMRYPEVTSLRDVDYVMIEEEIANLLPLSKQRINYVLDENARVHQVKAALLSDDIGAVGPLLYASHEGLRLDYEVSCEELDFIVDWTKQVGDILGARMMGGGFGGCVIALLKPSHTMANFDRLSIEYNKVFGHNPACYPVKLSKGVHRVN